MCLPLSVCLPMCSPNTEYPCNFAGRRAVFRADRHRADTQVRPYVDYDEMNMIGHANECIALDVRKCVFQFRSFPLEPAMRSVAGKLCTSAS